MKVVIKTDGQYIGECEIVLFKPKSRDEVYKRLAEVVGDNISTPNGKSFIESRLDAYDRVVKNWNQLYPNKYFIGKVTGIYKLYSNGLNTTDNKFAEIRSLELRPKIKSWRYRNNCRVSYYYSGYMYDIIRVNDKTIHGYGTNTERETISSIFNSIETKGNVCGINVNDIVLTKGYRRSDITTDGIKKVMNRKSNNNIQ